MSVMKTEGEILGRKKSPKEKMSLEWFGAWADEDVWAEWERGEVTVRKPATCLHHFAGFPQTLPRLFLERRDGGVVLTAAFATKLPISSRVREPNLPVLKENLKRIKETDLDGPADLFVEIASEENILRNRETKFAESEIDGVHECWGTDPKRKRAEFPFQVKVQGLSESWQRREGFLSQCRFEGFPHQS